MMNASLVMRRITCVFAVCLGIIAVCGVLPAYAESPINMGGQRVADHAQVVEDDMVDLNSTLSSTDLYVAYVKSFDGEDATQWCIETAQKSALHSRAVLLAVATQDRSYDLCAGSDVELSSANRQAIGEAVREPLSQGNWAQAATTAASTLARYTNAGSSTQNYSDRVVHEAEDTHTFGYWLIAIGVVAFLLLGISSLHNRKKKRQTAASTSSPQPPSVSREEAARIVLAADDGVRQAGEDLQFAAAELGEDQVTRFRSELERAGQARDRAWEFLHRAQQAPEGQADDNIRQALEQAQAARDAIASQARYVDQARTTQERAFANLEAAERVHMDRLHELGQAEAELARLHQDFSDTPFTSLDDNPEQARRLLSSAEHAIEEGKKAWEQGDRKAAVEDVVIAQRALQQAGTQIGQIMSARHTLGDITQALLHEISALGEDLDDAARLAPHSQAVKPLVAEASQAIMQADQAREGMGDPLAAIERMRQANAALDAVLDPMREKEVTDRRVKESLQWKLQQAQRHVAEAEAYISSHRGAVDAVARERSQQAQRLLSQAEKDLDRNVQAAQKAIDEADALAMQAQAIAEQDVAGRRSSAEWGNVRGRYGSGVDMGSLILGGILGSALGGGHHNSGLSWGGFGTDDSDGFGGGFSGGFGGSNGGFSGGFGGGSF